MMKNSDGPRSRFLVVFSPFILIGFLLGASQPASAGIVPAASPSLADVQAAIAAARSGDTVTVPAGSATWTGRLVISKGINLIGAGADVTIITSNYTQPNPGNTMDPANWLIVYSPTSPALNEPFRLSGFTLDLNLKCPSINLYNYTNIAINNIRIDHNTIKNTPGSSIYAIGPVYGVIDHNTISGLGIIFESLGIQKAAWTYLTFDLGTGNNMYFEDNVVTINNTAHGGAQGGRYCIRYNTYTSSNDLYPFCDAHGNQAMSDAYSTMGVEIYENVLNAGSKGIGVFDIRGGKGISFNNRINTTGSVTQKVRETDNDNLTPPANDVISGQPQHVSDSYFWGNRKNGTTPVATYVDGGVDYGGTIGIVPQANRDFWDENANFNGTSGVGVGTKANRPATCAAGVAYWATDERVLYKATAANTWTAYYRPYPYPHPLTLGAIVPPAPTQPTVATSAVSGITAAGATTGGNVTSDGGSSVTARGVCWGPSANPTVSGSHTSDGTGTGAFTSTLSGLSGGTTYHLRAYAVNSAGTAYGTDVTFTTSPAAVTVPTVTTTAVSAVTTTGAVTGGSVTSAGGSAVTARGVCWGASANPTVSGSHTSDGSGTGAFASTLSGLSVGATYHLRAYAVNSAGTAYGSDVAFRTHGLDKKTVDFNGDGLPDILWRNSLSGENLVWFLGPDSVSPASSLALGLSMSNSPAEPLQEAKGGLFGAIDNLFAGAAPQLSWSPAVAGAGAPETLSETVFEKVRPIAATWTASLGLTNSALASAVVYARLPAVADTSWQIVGAADFNDDGQTDILWRNSRTGDNYVWVMNGMTRSNGIYLPSVADVTWQIAGTGDFDGDGEIDILWRNGATGQNIVWHMNGTALIRYEFISSVTDVNWQAVGIGDFDRDGKPDILWRNSATGANIVWYMNGTALIRYEYLTPVADVNWQIAGAGDFDGDGNMDILWRNYATGENYIWHMNGATFIDGVYLATIADLSWRIVGR